MSEPRVYTIAEICERLHWSRRTFFARRKAGLVPFLEEIEPRLGHPRYRADLVDRWLSNEWQQQARGRRFFHTAKQQTA